MVASTVALRAPILWRAIDRRHTEMRRTEERHGALPLRSVLQETFRAWMMPLALIVLVLGCRQLVLMTDIVESSRVVDYVLRFVALIILVPCLKALRVVCARRPFFLSLAPRTFVFVWDSVTQEEFGFKLAFCFINALALAIPAPLLYTPQVLAVLNFSPTLQNVVRAVRGPFAQLALTTFLGMLVIHVFMVMAFWSFPQDLVDRGGYYGDEEEVPDTIDEVTHVDDDDGFQRHETMCSSMLSCCKCCLLLNC